MKEGWLAGLFTTVARQSLLSNQESIFRLADDFPYFMGKIKDIETILRDIKLWRDMYKSHLQGIETIAKQKREATV
jgi:hypothetical protein